MEIYLVIISLVFSAFFSGIEIAYVTANKLKLELMKKRGTFFSKVLAIPTSSPSFFLGTTLIGNNIAIIIFTIMMARLLEPFITVTLPAVVNNEFFLLLIQTIVTTIVILILGEFIPKALFRIKADGALKLFAFPLFLIYCLLYPIVWFIISLTHWLLRFLGVPFNENPLVFSHADLEHFINQFVKNKEEEKEINTDIFERALELREVRAKECMIPRTEIEALDVNETIEGLITKFTETRLSRIIIFEETIDSILGYVHHFDLLKNPDNIRSIIFPIKVIPETMLAKDILSLFMKDHKSVCWVVDEFGGTSGIVTLEDVLEEIFGEIKDEHDTEEFLEKQVTEDEFIFSGRLELDYLNEKYSLNFPGGDYKTLAGLILSYYENIPPRGEEIIISNFKFRVLNVNETRIDTVRLQVLSGNLPS